MSVIIHILGLMIASGWRNACRMPPFRTHILCSSFHPSTPPPLRASASRHACVSFDFPAKEFGAKFYLIVVCRAFATHFVWRMFFEARLECWTRRTRCECGLGVQRTGHQRASQPASRISIQHTKQRRVDHIQKTWSLRTSTAHSQARNMYMERAVQSF